MSLAVITLAAGKGSRMKSDLPKVLHPLAGKPMVQHVLESTLALEPTSQHVVVGHGAQQVKNALANQSVQFALQAEQKGTGHAVAQAMDDNNAIQDSDTVLVLYGDVPLISSDTLRALLAKAQNGLALLTVTLADPTGYGRIVRDEHQSVTAIVEHKDASASERAICEVNTGILAVNAAHLRRWLPLLKAENAQGEYYLTDIVALAVNDGVAVDAISSPNEYEVQGVNDRLQLAELERVYQYNQACELMRQGATLADPQRLDIRGKVTVGADVFIDVGCVFEGDVTLADGVRVGPYCVIRNSHLGSQTELDAHCVLDGAKIESQGQIGPFARLRPGAELGSGAKVGNFCEVKKATLGAGAKVNHLSYIGDARVGQGVNIGAGTITCNYDGVNKHQTVIGDGTFIGSNSSLVAPVEIGQNATIGAGSVITQSVDDDALAVGRGRQRNIENWPRPKKS